MFYDFIFLLKILINFHVSLGKINYISLMQLQIVLCWLVQECRESLTKLRVKLCSLPGYSVNKPWFFLKKPTSDNAIYHVTSHTSYSASWFPIFLCHLPGLFIQSSELSSPSSSHGVGWPIKHSHSKRDRLAAHSEVVIQQKFWLHLLCLPRASQLGRKLLEETHFQIQEVVRGLQGAPWACLPQTHVSSKQKSSAKVQTFSCQSNHLHL